MTKNAVNELFQKHTEDIRNGLLACWKEDVKSDDSVTIYDRTDPNDHNKMDEDTDSSNNSWMSSKQNHMKTS